jgi:cephalosporin-C deacetylase-like acetyl esterase
MKKKKIVGFYSILIWMLILLSLSGNVAAQDELDVFKGWIGFRDLNNSLYDHFSAQAYDQLKTRKDAVAKLNTLGECKKRQEQVRAILQDAVGQFPSKAPLNARVLRIVPKEDFRIEHVIFESRPGFKVTSSLFIPLSLKGKAPAVIYCSGHGATGYRSKIYQHVILNLVKKGFIVFAFDPIGQGERLGYFDQQTNRSLLGSPTKEHSFPGSQVFITGSTMANYFIWDGIRAVDYLLTRPEVDPSRIGITGRSGGGTQSAQIAAFDDRILAAAPENYLTDYTRLLQSKGPQDAEQNFYRGIYLGIDHPDLLEVRAPKPVLMVLTYNDMFNIQGARDTYHEASKIYNLFGKNENLCVTEDFGGHTSTKKNREAIYAFFQKFLSNPGDSRDEEVVTLTDDEIRVTPTGQLSTSEGSETVFSLNQRQSEKAYLALQRSRGDLDNWLPQVVANAKKLSGYKKPGQISAPVLTGMLEKNGYHIEKYFINGESDYPIPYLLYVPTRLNNKALLYLHPNGKKADSINVELIQPLLNEGYIILAPDLIGTGELFPSGYQGDAGFGNVSYNLWYASFMVGKSILGLRVSDLERLTSILSKDPRVKEIDAVAQGNMSPILLHCAAFAPVFTRMALIDPILSYRSIAMEKFYSPDYIFNAVPYALTSYDLPDLAACLAPAWLFISNVVDGAGKSSDSEIIKDDIEIIRRGYSTKSSTEKLIVFNGNTVEKLIDFLKK